MPIKKPAIGAVGMTAVNLIILIDSKDMKLPGSNAQTTPTSGISQVEVRGGLFYPLTLEKFLKRPRP